MGYFMILRTSVNTVTPYVFTGGVLNQSLKELCMDYTSQRLRHLHMPILQATNMETYIFAIEALPKWTLDIVSINAGTKKRVR
jgi:hypothetical protein